MKHTLTLTTLGNLDDGAVGALFDSIIGDILRDCDDRPALRKPRKVTLTVSFTPVPDDRAHLLRGVDVHAHVKSSVPAQTTRAEYLRTHVDLENGTGHVDALLPESYQQPLFGDKS